MIEFFLENFDSNVKIFAKNSSNNQNFQPMHSSISRAILPPRRFGPFLATLRKRLRAPSRNRQSSWRRSWRPLWNRSFSGHSVHHVDREQHHHLVLVHCGKTRAAGTVFAMAYWDGLKFLKNFDFFQSEFVCSRILILENKTKTRKSDENKKFEYN